MSVYKCEQATLNILAEVAAERMRQDAKWGRQDHPSVLSEHAPFPTALSLHYGIPHDEIAKATCDEAFAAGHGTFADIAIEEVSEAICAPDDDRRRAELVQCAAVFVSWIEAIDRRKLGVDPPEGKVFSHWLCSKSPYPPVEDTNAVRVSGMVQDGWTVTPVYAEEKGAPS